MSGSSSSNKTKSFNSIVHDYAKFGLNLSRRDNLIFYKLLGFLLRNDKSFPYSNEKLALNSLYKISSIKEALNNLEKIGLIERVGSSYQRRFSKGKVLVNICIHSQYCIDLELKQNCTHGQSLASTSQKVAGTSQKAATIELYKNLLKLNNKEIFKNPNPKPPTPSTRKPTTMDLQEFSHGVKGYEWVGEYRKSQGLE